MKIQTPAGGGKAQKSQLQKEMMSKKDFRETSYVENFYKTVYKNKLREEAYKAVISAYLRHFSKDD